MNSLPPVPPPEIPLPTPLFTQTKAIALELNVPSRVFDITLTLRGFNHKFQESAQERHEWVDIDTVTDSTPNKTEAVSLSYSTARDQSGNITQYFSEMTLGHTTYKIQELNYGVSAIIKVRR